MSTHQPVLLDEVLESLQVHADGVYVDATFGRGGHSMAILDRLGPAGRLVAFDRDPEAVAAALDACGADERFTIERGAFSTMERTLAAMGIAGRVDGVLADLGVSSPQLDEAGRGFSFVADGPLDMRMDPETGMSASEWLASVSETDLVRVLREWGEERFARRIAKRLIERRTERPFLRTGDLAEVVARAVPTREPGKHPATRTFQAIRIAVNSEMDELEALLPQAARCLKPGGRLCTIAFHSLEDRIVKRFLRGPVFQGGPRGLPPPEATGPVMRPVGKAKRASKEELERNPRSRSAILRVGERVS